MKILEKAFICSFVLILSFSCIAFSAQCSDIENSVLRMHVIANSNSNEDQAVKLKVRDAVVEKGACLLENAASKEDAVRILSENLELLREISESELIKNGFSQSVEVSLEKAFFPTREYDNITLPAGNYDSVLVKIGEAKGKNFWCVMFPSMCLPAAEKSDALCEVLSGGEREIVENPKSYKIEWKTAEIFEKVRDFFMKFKG